MLARPIASVTFDHVGKVYDSDVRALREFTLDIDDGEFVVLRRSLRMWQDDGAAQLRLEPRNLLQRARQRKAGAFEQELPREQRPVQAPGRQHALGHAANVPNGAGRSRRDRALDENEAAAGSAATAASRVSD